MHNTSRATQWNDSADKLKRWMSADNYFEQFVKKLHIRPDWTVLDIGCGPGDVSMWAAKRAKHVTSLDHAGKMLDFLKEDSVKRGLTNISYVQSAWDDVLATDVAMHDVVIASRSIGTMHDKKAALSRIALCTRQYAYITIGCKVKTPVARSIDKILGKKSGASSSFLIAYNHLYRMNIRANVEFIYGRNLFTDLDDVLERCSWGLEGLTSQQERSLFDILGRTMVKRRDGSLSFPYNDLCWAFIWWQNQSPSVNKK